MASFLVAALIIANLGIGLVAMTMPQPMIPGLRDYFGTDQSTAQLTFVIYLAAYALTQLVAGPLSDVYGRKPVLITGMGLFIVGSLGCALAPSIEFLILSRLVQGAGACCGLVISRAMVQDLYEGKRRTQMMAYIGMFMGMLPPFATLLGGFYAVHVGWRASFWTLVALGIAIGILTWFNLPESRSRQGGASPLRFLASGFVQLVKVRSFLGYTGVGIGTFGGFYAYISGVPLVLIDAMGVSPDLVGLFIMFVPVSYVLGNYLAATWLVRRMTPNRMMVCGMALTMSGQVISLVLGVAGLHDPLAFVAPLSLMGFGNGLIIPVAISGSVSTLPRYAGAAAAINGATQQASGALLGIVVGLIAYQTAVPLAAILVGASAFSFLCLPLIRQRRQAEAPAAAAD